MFRLSNLFALLLLAPVVWSQETFEAVEKQFKGERDRPALLKRFLAFQRLAKTSDQRALQILAQCYAKPRPPEEQERFLIAWLAGDSFRDTDAFLAWSDRHTRTADAWLRYQALRAAPVKRLRSCALDQKAKPLFRAAALEAAGASKDRAALAIVPPVLANLPKQAPARALLIESCAAVLRGHRAAKGSPEFRAAAEPLIALLAKKAPTSERTRLTIARQLAVVFGSKRVTTRMGYWRQLLGYEEVKDDKGPTQALPHFFGVEASGTRIAYVIDLSDSMLKPLTKKEREDIMRPVTGKAAHPDADLPWAKIRNRFDLARAVLERSLKSLDKNMQFTIVGLGKKAEFFAATKGLVKASRSRVAKAIRELNDIEPGPKTAKRPHGTLRGETNIHGALMLAFRARKKGMEESNEHVAAKLFADGCDTIFLLSDGAPTDDNFGHVDAFEGGKVAVDAEAGKTELSNRKSAFFRGPYRIPRYLLRDLERMNLFRKVELHCIALGEADMELLDGIARIGCGKVRKIGSKR
jgi:hypothetical protein